MNTTNIANIVDRYASASAWDRFHIKHRMRLCPHDELLPHLPHSGNLLDIGCGFGLLGWFLAEERPEVEYFGSDIDVRKVELARSAFARHPRGSRASQLYDADPRDWADRPTQFTTVTILDVLLLLPLELQKELFDFACSVLEKKPESAIILKILPQLTGKHRYRTWIQENIMVNVLRKTKSSGALFTTQDPALYAAWGKEHGLNCEESPQPTNPPSTLLVLRHAEV